MSILISVAVLTLCFFLFPIQTINWLVKKAKARAASWSALFPKEENKN